MQRDRRVGAGYVEQMKTCRMSLEAHLFVNNERRDTVKRKAVLETRTRSAYPSAANHD